MQAGSAFIDFAFDEGGTMLLSPPSSPLPLRAAIALAGLCALAACAAPKGGSSEGASESARGAAPTERYDAAAIRTVQRRLDALGYAAGPVDGAYGPATRSGILAFQRDHGLEPTGRPTERLLAALRQAEPMATPDKAPSRLRTDDAPDRSPNGAAAGGSRAPRGGVDDPVRLRRPDPAAGTAEQPARNTAAAETAPDQTASDESAPSESAPGGSSEPDSAIAAGTGTARASDAAPESPAGGNNAGSTQSADGQAETTREADGTATPKLSELDLAGTRWRLAGGPNRAIQITLKPDGEVDAPVGDWSWRRDGRKIHLTFDSGTRSRSTRTGELVSRDRIEGTGQDTFGRSWSWHASRVSKSAANR